MDGKFITFEGIEGSGKTTQIKLVKEILESKGLTVICTREPGGTKIGDKIRDVLLDPSNKEMNPLTELILYEASRAQHLEELIKPALKNGVIVLCDRFSDSTIAYQGAARKIASSTLIDIDKIATGGLKPDLTIVLDIDPKEGLKRANKRGKLDRFEQEEISFHERVRKGYLDLAKKEPARVKLVDGSRSPTVIHKDIATLLNHLLKI